MDKRSGSTPGQGPTLFIRGCFFIRWNSLNPHLAGGSAGVQQGMLWRKVPHWECKPEGGKELFLVSGFYRNGNPNISLQQLEDCRCPKARIVPKLSGCGFLGSLLIITRQFLSSKLYKLLRKWVFLKQIWKTWENRFLGKWLKAGSQVPSSFLC